MSWERYYSDVRLTYDRMADGYDSTVGRTLVSRRAKDLAVEVIASVSPTEGSLLDIGCYTGTESMLLAKRGFRVVGVDLSPRMVELARAKAKRWGVVSNANFLVARASELAVVRGSGFGPFDTAFSVYGTLNLEPRLESFKGSLLPCLKPHATLVVGLLNPVVMYELLVGPLFLRFDGYRKLGRGPVSTRVGVGSDRLTAFLYTPGEFARFMSPEFALRQTLGVHVFYPPPRPREGTNEGFWRAARALDRLERRFERSRLLSALGLFTLLVFEKT